MKTITKYVNNRVWLCAALLVVSVSACQTAAPQVTVAPATAAIATSAPIDTPTAQPTLAPLPIPFELTSPSFVNGGMIPKQFACTGENISPELNWGEPPAGTQSFALIFNDPGTGSGEWVHWVAYNLPPTARMLQQDLPAGDQLAGGRLQGANSWGNRAFGGPCPPTGSTHTYVFTLYALDAMLESGTRLNKEELLAAMEGHILAQVDLSASFTR